MAGGRLAVREMPAYGEDLQFGDDAGKAFTYALNSLGYETDDGPAILDAGVEGARTRLPRGLAWQEGYAIGLLAECDGDYGRLLAAAEELRGKICEARRKWAAETPERPQRFAGAQFYRAIDLCEHAMVMIELAGARTDDEARRGLAARCRRERARIAVGPLVGDDVVDYLDGES